MPCEPDRPAAGPGGRRRRTPVSKKFEKVLDIVGHEQYMNIHRLGGRPRGAQSDGLRSYRPTKIYGRELGLPISAQPAGPLRNMTDHDISRQFMTRGDIPIRAFDRSPGFGPVLRIRRRDES